MIVTCNIGKPTAVTVTKTGAVIQIPGGIAVDSAMEINE